MVGMRMGLEMKMGQQLIMTPQLQQAIKLLQLSRVELEELIDQALVENPTLETQNPEEEEVTPEEKDESKTDDLTDDQAQLSYDEEWQQYVEGGAGVIQESRSHHDHDDESNPLEATISRTQSLMDHLFWQLEITKLTELETEIGEHIIGNLDDDGYLYTSLRELIATTPLLKKQISQALEEGSIKPLYPESGNDAFDFHHEMTKKVEKKHKGKKKAPILNEDEEPQEILSTEDISDEDCAVLERMLMVIQNFDPPGVGARSLQECLENQLVYLKMGDSLAFRIIQENMHLLEQKDLKRIARNYKVDISEVVSAYHLITELEPKPGRPFGREVTQYVIPDVYIYKRGAEYIVNMNQDSIPRLRINPYYQELIQKEMEKKKADAKAEVKVENKKEEEQDMTTLYIQEKIKSGDWLMKSIEQRQKTIFRVSKSILKYQYEFFEKGIDYLKPLVLKDVADDIEVHESTVSRITTNKYMHTPQGIFELKYFFTSGIDQGDGDVVSSKKIKDYIKKMIDSEDKKKPFTDLQIKNELLENAKIKVARRTVAKYREAMNILPSNKRKQLF